MSISKTNPDTPNIEMELRSGQTPTKLNTLSNMSVAFPPMFILTLLDYATVKVRYDLYKQRNGAIIGHGGAFASVGYSNLFERSW